MSPNLIFYVGIALSIIVIIGAIISAIMLRIYKVRLDRQFDSEYGKRR